MVGSNFTFNVNVWPGLSRSGNAPPESVKPVPLNAAELIVTGPVPVEDNVKDCVDPEPTVKFPNARLAALTVSMDVAVLPLPPTP